jgi:hypothetical protein
VLDILNTGQIGNDCTETRTFITLCIAEGLNGLPGQHRQPRRPFSELAKINGHGWLLNISSSTLFTVPRPFVRQMPPIGEIIHFLIDAAHVAKVHLVTGAQRLPQNHDAIDACPIPAVLVYDEVALSPPLDLSVQARHAGVIQHHLTICPTPDLGDGSLAGIH